MGQTLKLTFLPPSLKQLPHLPSYILVCKPCHQLYPFHHPTQVFDPKQLGFPGWRQNSSLIPSSSVDKRELASSPSALSSLHRGRHGMHSSVHPAFHENSTDSGARPNLQAGSRGSIFSDSSYSVSSSMMRALSSKYWVTFG